MCQLYSCIKPPPNFEPGDASNVYSGCRIKKITGNYPFSNFTRVFTYNSNNDPVSVTNNEVGTGVPNVSFKYDSKRRLIRLEFNYHTGFESLHKYGYTQNRITTDTSYALGNYDAAGEPVGYHLKIISYLQYDKLNRVKSDSMILIGTQYNPSVRKYDYDATDL